MKPETKRFLIQYGICFGIASLIVFIVFWVKGFFTDSLATNLQILSDAFFVSGACFLMVAGMLFISGEGALIGIGFVLRSVALMFIPMGRQHHELYKDYRQRKLSEPKMKNDHCILFTGLLFFLVGVIFTVIWSVKFY